MTTVAKPQPPTALNAHRGHPHPTTIPARAVRAGTQTRPKAGRTPTHPHHSHHPHHPDDPHAPHHPTAPDPP